MATTRSLAVVGVFSDQHDAQQAIHELQRAGFQEDQIGVAARQREQPVTTRIEDLRHEGESGETYAAEGAVTGLAAGAGLGALAGVAILAGLLPPIGPAIAGGTLAVILSSAAAGAAAVGLAGALAGLGVSREEAEFYETEFHAGRIVLAVTADGREHEARAIIKRFGGYDMSERAEAQGEMPPASSGTFSAAETETPVAMPGEPGVPASVDLHGESARPRKASTVDVPVRSEDLVGDEQPTERRASVDVPVRKDDVESRPETRRTT